MASVELSIDAKIREHVSRGAALLDKINHGWYRRMNLDRLAMESCDDCILGQLYGDYIEGFRLVIASLPSTILYSAAGHGFTLRETEHCAVRSREGFAQLAEAWREEIRQRLAVKARPYE